MTRNIPAFETGGTTLAAALILAVHLGLVAHFAPRRVMMSDAPVLTGSFALKVYRASRIRMEMTRDGRFEAYDPRVLAGQVTGPGEAFGTRLFALGVPLLSRAKVAPGRAFNDIILALHVLFPLIGYAAARTFGFRRATACAVMAWWSGLWFFDSLVHVSWFTGRVCWVAASGMSISMFGCAWRFASMGKARWALLGALVGVATAIVHPVAAVFGSAMCLLLALSSSTLLGGRRGALVAVSIVPVALLALACRKGAALSTEPLSALFRPGMGAAFWDALEIRWTGYGAPGASRTMLRVLAIAGGIFGIARLRSVGDRRMRFFAVPLAVALVVAYAGAFLPVSWPLDPYFFAVPAALLAALPASELALDLHLFRLMRRGSPIVRAGLLVAAVVVLPRFGRTVLTFVPELLPARVIRSPLDLGVSSLVGLNEPMPDPLAYGTSIFRFTDLANYLVDHDGARGRVVVDDPALAGFLAVASPLSILGPIAERGAASAAADPSPLLDGQPTRAELSAFVRRYGVGFVVLAGPKGPFDGDVSGLAPETNIAEFRVRRVISEPSLFVEGAGRVTGAGLDSIRVEGATGGRVTLRFHFDPALMCRPACRVERVPADGDRAGFVSVPDPPPAFEIFFRRTR